VKAMSHHPAAHESCPLCGSGVSVEVDEDGTPTYTPLAVYGYCPVDGHECPWLASSPRDAAVGRPPRGDWEYLMWRIGG
jgi:hypothetical protein